MSELLFGRGGSADAIVDVAAVEFRFWAVVLAKKLMFDKTYKKIGVAGSSLPLLEIRVFTFYLKSTNLTTQVDPSSLPAVVPLNLFPAI